QRHIARIFLSIFAQDCRGSGDDTGAIRDRAMAPVISVAGIGFTDRRLELCIADVGERLNELSGRRINGLVDHWIHLSSVEFGWSAGCNGSLTRWKGKWRYALRAKAAGAGDLA